MPRCRKSYPKIQQTSEKCEVYLAMFYILLNQPIELLWISVIFCDRCKLCLPITPLTHHHKYTLNKVEYSGLYLYYNYYLVIQQKAVFYWLHLQHWNTDRYSLRYSSFDRIILDTSKECVTHFRFPHLLYNEQ